MKKLNFITTTFIAILAAFVLTACGGNGSNREGSRDASEANGTIDGTASPAANENSGRASETGTDTGPANDTVTTTTTRGNDPNSEGEDSPTDIYGKQ
ncbi:hypothetical protein [Flavobacterium sp.]|uniref:hypothetical protein n=1 Tax=Flavobacterium sp. TaxID=239 RepID=UPI003A8D39A0